jgi:hypothetical protein
MSGRLFDEGMCCANGDRPGLRLVLLLLGREADLMMRTIARSFLYAEAIAGVVLTLAWLSGETDLMVFTAPLFSLGSILVLYAFLSGSWVRAPSRLEGPLAVENAARQMHEFGTSKSPLRSLSRLAAQHRISAQWAISGALLLLTGWVLYRFAPLL